MCDKKRDNKREKYVVICDKVLICCDVWLQKW